MREFPVFVPRGAEHISAVITVPDGGPRGLVLLQPGGGGAPHSHRTAMFTRIARGLADRGIASARIDWKGVGDSSGVVAYSFRHLPVEDGLAVARFAMEALGTRTFGMAGNCGGARTALGILRQVPETRSAVLIMLKPLAGPRSQRKAVQRTKLIFKRFRRVGPMARRAYWSLRWRKAGAVLEAVAAVNAVSDLLLLEANTVKAGKLIGFVDGLQRKNGRHRLEMRELPGGATRGFHSLERQEFTVRHVLEWFDQTFPGTAPRPAGEPVERTRAIRH